MAAPPGALPRTNPWEAAVISAPTGELILIPECCQRTQEYNLAIIGQRRSPNPGRGRGARWGPEGVTEGISDDAIYSPPIPGTTLVVRVALFKTISTILTP